MRLLLLKAAVLLLLFGPDGLFSQPDKPTDAAIIARADTALRKLTRMHQEIQGIHPYLIPLHPVAVVGRDSLLIFDVDSVRQEYTLKKKVPFPFPMVTGIRASFPLSSYGDRPTCVVSPEVFDSLKGYATIFHEFVHCTQYLTCENALKGQLQIAQEAARTKDYGWEINHPFPFKDSAFVMNYSAFLSSLARHDTSTVRQSARELRNRLKRIDYEYMVWEEWKEGFARFIENQIRSRIGIEPNHAGKDQPYDRVAFYYGGEGFITYLTRNDPGHPDPEALFKRMIAFAE